MASMDMVNIAMAYIVMADERFDFTDPAGQMWNMGMRIDMCVGMRVERCTHMRMHGRVCRYVHASTLGTQLRSGGHRRRIFARLGMYAFI